MENTALISIELVSKFHAVPLDIESVRKRYFIEEEITPFEILRILKDHGFKARYKKFKSLRDLKKYPFPMIIVLNNNVYSVLLGVKEDKILYFDCVEKKPVQLKLEEFLKLWDYKAIVLYPKFKQTEFFLNFKWLFNEFFKYKSTFSEAILASLFIQIFALVTPLFIQIIVDKVLPHYAVSTLQVIGLAFLIVILFDGLLNFMRNYLLYYTANKIDAGLGAKVYRHLLSLPFRYFETRKVGSIIARIRELENLRQFMTSISLTLLLDTIFSIVFIIVMLIYSIILTIIVLIFIGVVALISYFSTPFIKQRLDDKFQKGAHMHAFLVESITGIQTIKASAIEGKMMKNWEDYLGQYILSSFKLSNLANVVFSISQTLQKLMILVVIYLGVSQVFENKLTIGQLIAFQMFAGQLTMPILRLVHMWQDFQQAKLSLERLGDIINTPSEVSGGAVKLSDIKGEIVFKNVSFRYSADLPEVLKNINFKIEPGMLVGIVGRSGSGKSTIGKLIQRLYLPNEGSILIDGIDIKQIDPLFLRSKIGVVLQENFLFSGTVKENIAIAKPQATMEEIIYAAMLSGTHEFISEMPLGYDTPIEERGESLSGGQKQRIAIARALIINPKILILDEATSALDYESERLIYETLRKLKRKLTILFISHRLSFMKECDLILVIDKGRLIEIGTHEFLMKNKGLYAYLYKQQESV
uniref:Type I secretion system permease/ATPase n=1 Tax=Thermodesulfobacterium geofontis TaxID=1295609 RepID=A0A7C4JR17_9BACT